MQYSVFHNRTFGHSTFQGVGPAYADVTSIHIQVNDEPISDSASVAFYLLDPVVPLGTISYVDGIPYGIVTSSFPLPATLTVGDSGAFDNVTYYHDSTMSSVVADETGTYSVLAKDSRSLLFCLNSTISAVTEQGSADGLDNGTETVCYTVDASGTADLASVALMVNGVALNFR